MPGLLLPCSSKMGGLVMGMPDVCLTPAPPAPPVPVPYPNLAQLASADGAVTKVLVEHKETVTEGAKIPNSSGDEAGTNGGVISHANMKEAVPKVTSSKVFFGGKKAVFVTATFGCNGTNANCPVGLQSVPSQAKVFVGM